MQPERLPAAEIEPVIGAQHAFSVAVHVKLFAQRHLCGIPAATHLRDRIGASAPNRADRERSQNEPSGSLRGVSQTCTLPFSRGNATLTCGCSIPGRPPTR